MTLKHHLSARNVALAALALWLLSLALTGLVLYSHQKHLAGMQILVTGWLSPLAGNFAWFANIFFLWGVLRLMAGTAPAVSSILAILLSLDTFRFDRYPLNEAGAATAVYGYGWGAIFWFLSLCLLVAAVGVRRRELHPDLHEPASPEWLQPLGTFLFIATLTTTAFLAIHDRQRANTAERQRLAGLVFKHGKVCRAPNPAATKPLNDFIGPLEVAKDKRAVHAAYPLYQVKSLLAWGIPAVRMDGQDYSIGVGTHSGELVSQPASGPPGAILHVRDCPGRNICAKLIDARTKRIVFNQTWQREQLASVEQYYCPDYHGFPGPTEQPRQLILQALGLPEVATDERLFALSKTPPRVEGTILTRAMGGETRRIKLARWRQLHPDDTSIALPHEIVNSSCPSNVGWSTEGLEVRQHTGRSFVVNDKSYYLPYRYQHHNAICAGQRVYIYFGLARSGKYYLNIESRSLPEFRKLWAAIIVIPYAPDGARDNVLTVQSVTEVSPDVTMELVDNDTGQVLLLRAPLVHNVAH